MKTLLFETPMHLVATCLFVSIETVILIFLPAYLLVRPDDKKITHSLIVIFLLIIYNLIGGLVPDTKLSGSFFIRVIVLLTNIGFLLFFSLQLIKKRRMDNKKSIELKQQLRRSENSVREKDEQIKELEKSHEQERNNSIHLLRSEQEKLIELLQIWRRRQNTEMENKDKRIKELEKIIKQEKNNYINLVHERNTLSALSFKELQRKIETMLNFIQNLPIAQPWRSNVKENCKLYNLTPLETKVVEMVFKLRAKKGKGKDKAIAEKLNISVYTVSTHIQNILKKVGVLNKEDLILTFIDEPSDQINYRNGGSSLAE